LFLCRSFADQIAADHQPGGDPYVNLQLHRPNIEATDRGNRVQPRPDRPLRVVLMGLRVAEIDQHCVADGLADKAIEAGDDFDDGTVIRGDNLAQIFGIEPRRQRRRADEVADHHRQLPPLGR